MRISPFGPARRRMQLWSSRPVRADAGSGSAIAGTLPDSARAPWLPTPVDKVVTAPPDGSAVPCVRLRARDPTAPDTRASRWHGTSAAAGSPDPPAFRSVAPPPLTTTACQQGQSLPQRSRYGRSFRARSRPMSRRSLSTSTPSRAESARRPKADAARDIIGGGVQDLNDRGLDRVDPLAVDVARQGFGEAALPWPAAGFVDTKIRS